MRRGNRGGHRGKSTENPGTQEKRPEAPGQNSGKNRKRENKGGTGEKLREEQGIQGKSKENNSQGEIRATGKQRSNQTKE